jgi:hypothetical protein
MINNKQIIENSFGFNLRIDLFMDITPGPYNNSGYTVDSLELYYKNIILNSIPQIRDRIDVIFSYRNIILSIKTKENGILKTIKLKHEGSYVLDSLYEFQNIKYFSSETSFRIEIGYIDKNTAFITMEIVSYSYNPMVFGK